MSRKAVCQLWLESERGWGTRPDGYSLHIDDAARQEYIKKYWGTMPDSVPDEYSRPAGDPYIVSVSERVYDQLRTEKNQRFYENNPPNRV